MMGLAIESVLKDIMLRHLQEEGGHPDNNYERRTEKKKRTRTRIGWMKEQEECAGRFNQHWNNHDVSSEAGVVGFIRGESGRAHARHQRIVNDLDKPDDAGHEEGGRGLDEKVSSHAVTSAKQGASFCAWRAKVGICNFTEVKS
jgi:hypothetical protein